MFFIPNTSAPVVQLLNATVPITRFNKGEAGKIIDEVKQDGIRVIVKNNVPECILITVDEYSRLYEAANRNIRLIQTKESEEKRKAFIEKIRARAVPPMDAQITYQEALNRYGTAPIEIDGEAVDELRRISTL